jgi:hypothetical protein
MVGQDAAIELPTLEGYRLQRKYFALPKPKYADPLQVSKLAS